MLVTSVPRRIVAEALAALESAEIRARSVVISPVSIFDYLRFCSGDDDEHVVTLVEDAGSVDQSLRIAAGAQVAQRLGGGGLAVLVDCGEDLGHGCLR